MLPSAFVYCSVPKLLTSFLSCILWQCRIWIVCLLLKWIMLIAFYLYLWCCPLRIRFLWTWPEWIVFNCVLLYTVFRCWRCWLWYTHSIRLIVCLDVRKRLLHESSVFLKYLNIYRILLLRWHLWQQLFKWLPFLQTLWHCVLNYKENDFYILLHYDD
jgi:hypothetical protein